MARTPGGTVHVGKAAALIVAAVVLGVIVLRDSGSVGSISSAAIRDAIEDSLTATTLPFEDETTSTTLAAERPANVVKVVAVNASGKAGEAGRATTKLQSAGYNVLSPGNATQAVTNSKPAALVYVVTAGYEREARTIAALFSLPDSAVRALPSPSPSPDIKGDVNIAVLVGTGITI